MSVVTIGNDFPFFGVQGVNEVSCAYDTVNEKIVVAFENPFDSNKGYAVVGTVTGMEISWGTPVKVLDSDAQEINIFYDSVSGKFVVSAYWNKCVVVEVSGTSVNCGSDTTIDSSDTRSMYVKGTSTGGNIVLAYVTYSGNIPRVIVGAIAGLTISFGSPASFSPVRVSTPFSATYDSTNDKVVIFYKNYNAPNYCMTNVCSVSGTTITPGTPSQAYTSNSPSSLEASYNVTQGKIIMTFHDHISLVNVVLAGSVNGASMTYGTAVNWAVYDFPGEPQSVADVEHAALVFKKSSNNRPQLMRFDLSATPPTYDDQIEVSTNQASGMALVNISEGIFVVCFINLSDTLGSAHVVKIIPSVFWTNFKDQTETAS